MWKANLFVQTYLFVKQYVIRSSFRFSKNTSLQSKFRAVHAGVQILLSWEQKCSKAISTLKEDYLVLRHPNLYIIIEDAQIYTQFLFRGSPVVDNFLCSSSRVKHLRNTSTGVIHHLWNLQRTGILAYISVVEIYGVQTDCTVSFEMISRDNFMTVSAHLWMDPKATLKLIILSSARGSLPFKQSSFRDSQHVIPKRGIIDSISNVLFCSSMNISFSNLQRITKFKSLCQVCDQLATLERLILLSPYLQKIRYSL